VNQLGSREEAEDAVQSTFLNAHRALQRGVRPDAELAWLFKIAHNVCLTRRRSSWRRGRVEAPSDLQSVQDVLPAPAREQADELIRLPDALAEMPVKQRRAILLREWQGLSYREIAEELRLSQSAVETLIFRARRTLASNLEVEPDRNGLLARVRQAFDVGTIAAALKTLFAGGTAIKATAAAVAVTGAVVVAKTAPTALPAASKEKPSAAAFGLATAETAKASHDARRASETPAARSRAKTAAPIAAKVSPALSPAADSTEPETEATVESATESSRPALTHPTKPAPAEKPLLPQANGQPPAGPDKAKAKEQKPEPTLPAPAIEAPAPTGPPAEHLPATMPENANGPPADTPNGPKK
jgi:RNA polymerase sigma factor (sigma-70 family)